MITIEKQNESVNVSDLAQHISVVLTDVYGVSPWSLEQIKKDILHPLTVYMLAWDKTSLVGFLAFQTTEYEIEILQIAVAKHYQKQKIATKLFQSLPVDKAIFLEVRESNQTALSFYKKEQFKEIGRRKDYYKQPIEDAIIMKRESHER